MRKSQLHILWDDHVTAALDLETKKAQAGVTCETLQERVKRTKRAYEEFIRTGKVAK